jgi:hypothetical protein
MLLVLVPPKNQALAFYRSKIAFLPMYLKSFELKATKL